MNTAANIILCGFMGTGKTTVGQIIAARLGWSFVDTDALIESRQGRSVQVIFAQEGEGPFRQLEHALCEELIGWRRTVIATGGGIVIDPVNRANLARAGLVICLEAPADEIMRRLADQTDRPLLAGADPAQRIADLLARRAEAYRALPNRVNTAGLAPERVAERIIDLWEQFNR
jgi:shikimate kinase